MVRARMTAGLAGLVLLVAGCGGSGHPTTAPSSGALDLVHPGTLTVCTEVPFAPFEMTDSGPLGFKGFDIDLVRNLADDFNLDLKVVAKPFDSIVSGAALNDRTCDVAASAMTITAERAKSVDFTDGYYMSRQSLLVPAGSTFTSFAKLVGKRLGVEKDTTGAAYAKAHATGVTIVEFDSDAKAFDALKAGQIDGLVQDLPANLERQKGGGYGVVAAYDTQESYGLALRKGNDTLRAAINRDLAKMQRNGVLRTMYGTWFPIVR